MKIYSITHEMYISGLFGGSPPPEHIGTFLTRKLADAKLISLKEEMLERWPEMIIKDFSKDNKFGFSYGHPAGSMSFVPGSYVCHEQEVIEE